MLRTRSGSGSLLSYLIRNRIKPPLGSLVWAKYWAKRLKLGSHLFSAIVRDAWLRPKCERLGSANAISPIKVDGPVARLSIGSFCALGRIRFQLHEKVTIGDCVVINDGCQLITGSHDVHDSKWPLVAKPIIVEDYAWIATGAVILPGVTIGRGAVIGAFAVVSRSIPENAIAVGNPARIVSSRKAASFSYRPSHSYALYEAWLGPTKSAVECK
jgi:maltose O-acetyltransferase